MNYCLPDAMSILPWHLTTWQRLWSMKQQNRLPHAILLTGQEGVGKNNFTEQFTQALLCSANQESIKPCGQCHACHLARAKSHPDLRWVAPIESETIKIEQVRDSIQLNDQTSLQGTVRIVVFSSADKMTLGAANALLKTLEEPTVNTLLFLISARPLQLPATVRSRCHKVLLSKPVPHQAMQWLQQNVIPSLEEATLTWLLKLANGAPLKVLTLLQQDILTLRPKVYQGLVDLLQGRASPLQLAATWPLEQLTFILELLSSWVCDLLWIKLSLGPVNGTNEDYFPVLRKHTLPLHWLIRYTEKLQTHLVTLSHWQNINRQLLLEELLIEWATGAECGREN